MTIIDPKDLTALKLLARGRDPEWVSNASGLSKSAVERAGRAHGWPDLAQLKQQLAESGHNDVLPVHAPQPHSVVVQDRPRPAFVPSTSTVTPTPTAGRLELLLARAEKHDTAPIRAARNAVLTACSRLETHLQSREAGQRERAQLEASKAAAKSRVALLEKQLREAKAALRGKPAATKPTNSCNGAEPKIIRQWAAANNVACPAVGRVPASVVEQYQSSQLQEARTP